MRSASSVRRGCAAGAVAAALMGGCATDRLDELGASVTDVRSASVANERGAPVDPRAKGANAFADRSEERGASVESPSVVASVESPSALASSVERPSVIASDRRASAAGCVIDPWAHAARVLVDRYGDHLAAGGARPRLAELAAPGPWCTAVASLPDLDGDGVAEVEVTEACSYGTYGALHLLYLSSHGCQRFAGELVAGELQPGDGVTAGLRDLEARWSNGCAGAQFVWTRYAWTGQRYEAVDTATCDLCEEEPGYDPAAVAPICRALGR